MKLPSWLHKSRPSVVGEPPAMGCRIVVIEEGARMLQPLSSGSLDETIVIAEQAPGDSVGLVEQVAFRLGVLAREAKLLQSAELVLSGRRDVSTGISRRAVARTLLSGIAAAGGGELVVVAGDADSETRDALLDLVSRLLSEVPSRAVTIRVQFRSDSAPRAPKSGVRFAAPRDRAGRAPAHRAG